MRVKKWSFRTWLSIITAVLVVLLLIIAWEELVHAWELLGSVNPWILLLTLPIVLLNYYAAGEMVFSYLREKKRIVNFSPTTLMRVSLETNFVNHVLPSGGASGVSYMNWRLGHLGVAASKATMAQAVRFVAGFMAFTTLLIIAVIAVTIDSGVNRVVILVSSSLVGAMIAITVLGVYLISDLRRVRKASEWITRNVNRIVWRVTGGRKRVLLREPEVETFLADMHDDYLELKKDKQLLKKPFLWALVFTATDVAIYFVAFWALGTIVNPAPILIAYGVATVAGFAVVTPGGTGAYEALMVGILTIAGLTQGKAIAGVVLGRAIILLVILAIGYVFYQHALSRYGKDDRPDLQR